MRVTLVISLMLIGFGLRAQQLPAYSLWTQNPYVLNPAVSGYDMFMDFSLHGKKQWAGFDGSPFNQQLTMHSSINEMSLGVGGGFFNDNLGTIKHSGFLLSSAYHLQVGEEVKLGFGLGGRFSFYGLDQAKLNLHDPNDASISSQMRSGLVPDVSFGILLSKSNFMFGLSAQNMLSSKRDLGTNLAISDISHFNFYGYYRIEGNNKFTFTPAVYSSYIVGYPIYVDARFITSYMERYDLELGFKSSKDLVLGLGFEIIDYLKVSYNYDLVLSGLRPGTSGSHEILISYDFYYNPLYKGSKRRYKWITKGTRSLD